MGVILTTYKSWDDPPSTRQASEECLRSNEGCRYEYRLTVRQLRNSIDFQSGPRKKPPRKINPWGKHQKKRANLVVVLCFFFFVLVVVGVVFRSSGVCRAAKTRNKMQVKPPKPGNF